MMDQIQKRILEEVADLHTVPEGAYNIRANGASAGRNTTANIDIVSKTDVSGIDIRIKPGTKHESVHIPVVLSESGIKETVYNDFYIGEDSDIVIVAGCGIHNCGNQDSEHDGIHRFYVGKNAKVKYVEKHYGEGDGNGKRILKSRHRGIHGRRQLHGNGDGADQRRGFHDPDNGGRAGSRSQTGGAGTSSDSRKPAGGQRLCGSAEWRGCQCRRGFPVCGKG